MCRDLNLDCSSVGWRDGRGRVRRNRRVDVAINVPVVSYLASMIPFSEVGFTSLLICSDSVDRASRWLVL